MDKKKVVPVVRLTFPKFVGAQECDELETIVSTQYTNSGETLLCDLKETQAIYSVGIGMLVKFRNTTMNCGGTLMLINVSSRMKEMFQELNLDRLFTISESDDYITAIPTER